MGAPGVPSPVPPPRRRGSAHPLPHGKRHPQLPEPRRPPQLFAASSPSLPASAQQPATASRPAHKDITMISQGTPHARRTHKSASARPPPAPPPSLDAWVCRSVLASEAGAQQYHQPAHLHIPHGGEGNPSRLVVALFGQPSCQRQAALRHDHRRVLVVLRVRQRHGHG
jgi:hypothetical protein